MRMADNRRRKKRQSLFMGGNLRGGLHEPFGHTHQQMFHTALHLACGIQPVGQPQESNHEMPAGESFHGFVQQVLVQTIPLTYLPFHPVALDSSFKPLFRHTYHNTCRRKILPFHLHVYNTQRKGRKRSAPSGKELFDKYPAVQPFFLWQRICFHILSIHHRGRRVSQKDESSVRLCSLCGENTILLFICYARG